MHMTRRTYKLAKRKIGTYKVGTRKVLTVIPRVALIAAIWGAAGLTPARAVKPSETASQRWQSSLEAFAAADRDKAPSAGGVVFVGSSSIRLWEGLEDSFGPKVRIVKRGFGGSRLSDCASLVTQLVVPYQPRLVVVYAGDNDLAEGATPQEVLESFESLVNQVRTALPETRIAYVSIKPSPSRQKLLPHIREANLLIEQYTDTIPNLDYIDIHSAMLDKQGQIRADLFREDALHLNATGYAVWRNVITSHLPDAANALPPNAPVTAGANRGAVSLPSAGAVVPVSDPARR